MSAGYLAKLFFLADDTILSFLCAAKPLFSSDRQHLSYDDCLEVRGEIIRTVLCCIVYWSCAQS